jgi:hypothetical protein
MKRKFGSNKEQIVRENCIMNNFIIIVLFNAMLANKSRRNVWLQHIELTTGMKIAYEVSVTKPEAKK